MSRLRSGTFGYFLVLTQVMVTQGSRATFEKAGMWDAQSQRIKGDGLLGGGWNGLDSGEKHAVLAYFHESTHYNDITCLPAGAFYWRIWDVVRRYGDLYVAFIRELDLATQVDGPLRTWLRTAKAQRLVQTRLAKRAQFGPYVLGRPSRAAIRRDYCFAMLDEVDCLDRVTQELFNDPTPDFGRYRDDLNLAAEAIHARFLTEGAFRASDYERVPAQAWVECGGPRPPFRDEFFMSLSDIFELRAYAKELKILTLVNDVSFEPAVLTRAKQALSANAFAVLNRWVEERYAPQHLQYITDLALSGRIDPNCGYHAFAAFAPSGGYESEVPPMVKVDFHRNWPSYRIAALLTQLVDDRMLLATPERAEPGWYTDVGQYLFGPDTYPFTGMSLALRGMIPRRFRGPMDSPLMREWNASDPRPSTDIVVGNPEAEWTSDIYFEELNQVFAHNQAAYLRSFCQMSGPGFVEPKTYVLKDCVVGARRAPIGSSDPVLMERGTRYATQSLLCDYIGAIVSTSLLEAEDCRVEVESLIEKWGDADFLASIRAKVNEVYGAPFVKRFLV